MPKFVYKKPSQDDLNREVKKAQETKGNVFDNIILSQYPTLKIKDGKNNLRILPSTWGSKYFSYPVTVHYGCGPDNATYLCMEKLGEPCAVCDERRQLQREGDNEAANNIKPNSRFLAWVIDRDNMDSGPLIFNYGYKMGNAIAAVSQDDNGGALDIVDPDEGYDLSFVKTKLGADNKNVDYSGHLVARRPTPLHRDAATQERWLDFIVDNPLPDCLAKYDYDYIARVFKGHAPTVRDEVEDEPETRTSRRSLRDEIDDEIPEHGKVADTTEDTDDDPPFDVETGEIKEEESPRRRTRLADDDEAQPDVHERAASAVRQLRERRTR